ncbi:hypothetical protein FQR65_LT20590 [Abscondita terminalis]|nr:hypothetical protein FQR65_LT20590 [Abscondita terminalis]
MAAFACILGHASLTLAPSWIEAGCPRAARLFFLLVVVGLPLRAAHAAAASPPQVGAVDQVIAAPACPEQRIGAEQFLGPSAMPSPCCRGLQHMPAVVEGSHRRYRDAQPGGVEPVLPEIALAQQGLARERFPGVAGRACAVSRGRPARISGRGTSKSGSDSTPAHGPRPNRSAAWNPSRSRSTTCCEVSISKVSSGWRARQRAMRGSIQRWANDGSTDTRNCMELPEAVAAAERMPSSSKASATPGKAARAGGVQHDAASCAFEGESSCFLQSAVLCGRCEQSFSAVMADKLTKLSNWRNMSQSQVGQVPPVWPLQRHNPRGMHRKGLSACGLLGGWLHCMLQWRNRNRMGVRESLDDISEDVGAPAGWSASLGLAGDEDLGVNPDGGLIEHCKRRKGSRSSND